MARDTDRHTILRGTLDLLVLQAISERPRHGFEISVFLEAGTKGSLVIDDSALYQALHRLEARGLVQGEWGVSENNRRARYYRLTRTGRRHLADEGARLVAFARAITSLLSPARGKS